MERNALEVLEEIFRKMYDEKPTPPAAMQGHWVEPRSGRMLQIDADGTVAWRNVGKTNTETARWEIVEHHYEIEDRFLVECFRSFLEEGEDKTQYYCRAGLDELRLRKWLKERGL